VSFVPGNETHEAPGGQAGPESDGRVAGPCVQRTALESTHGVSVFAAPLFHCRREAVSSNRRLRGKSDAKRIFCSSSEPAKGVTRVTKE
jgi:hypothetical protein